MIHSFPPNVRIYLCTVRTDMRKSFDGLHALVTQVFKQNPLDGHLFLFVNRRGDRLKILWWDQDGFAIFYKRLEAGTFQVPTPTDAAAGIEIDAAQLGMLLNGIDMRSVKRRKRYTAT
jgi:transposase